MALELITRIEQREKEAQAIRSDVTARIREMKKAEQEKGETFLIETEKAARAEAAKLVADAEKKAEAMAAGMSDDVRARTGALDALFAKNADKAVRHVIGELSNP